MNKKLGKIEMVALATNLKDPAYTLNNLSADTLKNLSADTLKNLSAYTLKNLSAYTLKKVKDFWDTVPKLEKPYTKIWKDLQDGKRCHQQSTWGPKYSPVTEENICGTAMCTAGHLVNMGGEAAWNLRKVYGFEAAARFIHVKSCPDLPCQDFGPIPQEWALAYLEEMADRESKQ